MVFAAVFDSSSLFAVFLGAGAFFTGTAGFEAVFFAAFTVFVVDIGFFVFFVDLALIGALFAATDAGFFVFFADLALAAALFAATDAGFLVDLLIFFTIIPFLIYLLPPTRSF